MRIAVDAAASGVMRGGCTEIEYRGVDERGVELFHVGPVSGGTNNAAEFLAVVHALSGFPGAVVWSDSITALSWVRRGRTRSAARYSGPTRGMIDRAVAWLQTHPEARTRCRKWDTRTLGEIPADFGRKGRDGNGRWSAEWPGSPS